MHAKKPGKRRTYFRSLPVRVSAGHVTSDHVTSRSSTISPYHKCCLSCAHILLTWVELNIPFIEGTMWRKTRNRRVSGITFIRYAQNRKIGKSNKVFGSNKTKGYTQDSQNRLRSHKPEGGEP